MLDQSIWWFSFFMACCETIAWLPSRVKEAEKTEGCCCDLQRGSVWRHQQAECDPSLPVHQGEVSKTRAEEWEEEVSLVSVTHKMRDCQCMSDSYSFSWKWLTAGEILQTKIMKMLIPVTAALGDSLPFLCQASPHRFPFISWQR